MKNKILTVILAASVAISISSFNVHAQTLSNTNSTKTTTEFAQQMPIIKNLTKDEYCKRKAEIEKKSLEEVYKNVNADDAMLKVTLTGINFASDGGIVYKEVSWVDTIANADKVKCQITSGFLGKYNYGGGFYGIIGASDPFVEPSGTGTFSWNSSYKQVNCLRTGVYQLSAGGYVDGQVSLSLKTGFTKCGFSIEGTGSTTVHVRKHVTIDHTYTT